MLKEDVKISIIGTDYSTEGVTMVFIPRVGDIIKSDYFACHFDYDKRVFAVQSVHIKYDDDFDSIDYIELFVQEL